MSIFVILGLLVCIIEAQGSSAVTPVFVQKGGDVLLKVDADVPEDFSFAGWNFNKTIFLVKIPPGDKEPTVFPGYTGRIEFPEKKYSVKLKNLTEADSGVYTAKLVSAREEDRTLAQYNVTVQVRFPPGGEQPIVFDNYTEMIEFPEKIYSVKLKNPKESDRGVYTARVISLTDKDRTLAQYNVTVQDPVSPVELTVISVDFRSSECNLTVTCRTQDSHINSIFRCDYQTCSQEGGEQSEVTTSGASLRIYLSSSSIICNHSNEVSRTEDIEIIGHLCPLPDDPQSPPAGISVCLLKIVVFSVGLIIMVSAVITVHLMEKLKKHK